METEPGNLVEVLNLRLIYPVSSRTEMISNGIVVLNTYLNIYELLSH